MSRKNILILISLLLLATLACSLTSAAEDKAEEIATTQIADALSPEDNEAPAENGENAAGFVSPQLAEGIQSFRTRTIYTSVAEDGSTLQSMIMEGEYLNTEPPAEHVTMEMNLEEGAASEKIEYIRIDSQIWMYYADQWMSINDDSMDFLSDMLPNAEDTADMDWEKIGKEDVNGMKTTHYRITSSTPGMLDLFNGSEGEEFDEEMNFSAGTIDIYVNDNNVIVKQDIHTEGEMLNEEGVMQPMSMDFNFEVYDINANDIVIEPPNNEETGLGSALPVPDGATSSFNTPGFNVYNVPDGNADNILAFYEANDSLTITSKMGTADDGYVLMLQFEGQDYAITIAPAENGGIDISIMGMTE